MVGGQIAAGVIADCAEKNDFSFDSLNRYQEQASAALDPGSQFNGMFRDELLNKEEVMKDFFRRVKESWMIRICPSADRRSSICRRSWVSIFRLATMRY